MFSTFPSCSQMPVIFYHSEIHNLGFFISLFLYLFFGSGERGREKGVIKITVGLASTSWSQLPKEQPGRLTLYFMTLFQVHVDAGAAIHRDQ